MSQQSNADTTGESIDDCDLTQSERNRFFHGKLMTARDMEAEQVYHRGLFTRHHRHVTGYGVVDGLDATVTPVAEGLKVTLDPGYAIDCCGRPVVVPKETTDVVEEWEQREDEDLALYLEYAECVTESVPIPGSEDACERECAFNRVVETFSLDVQPAPAVRGRSYARWPDLGAAPASGVTHPRQVLPGRRPAPTRHRALGKAHGGMLGHLPPWTA